MPDRHKNALTSFVDQLSDRWRAVQKNDLESFGLDSTRGRCLQLRFAIPPAQDSDRFCLLCFQPQPVPDSLSTRTPGASAQAPLRTALSGGTSHQHSSQSMMVRPTFSRPWPRLDHRLPRHNPPRCSLREVRSGVQNIRPLLCLPTYISGCSGQLTKIDFLDAQPEAHSPTGNRTQVTRVTGGYTNHYTMEEEALAAASADAVKGRGKRLWPSLLRMLLTRSHTYIS